MSKPQKKISSFFKVKESTTQPLENDTPVVNEHVTNVGISSDRETSKRARPKELSINSINYDPAERSQIWEYASSQRDEVRRAHMNEVPCHPDANYDFPYSGPVGHKRSCQHHWFITFPWLDYSKSSDKLFCHPCFLFNYPGNSKVFTVEGFQSWKRVGGKDCAFLTHMGEVNSTHHKAVQARLDLLNQPRHIVHSFEKQSTQQREDNRLRLKISIDAAKYLTLQGLAFRGHNEKHDSLNRGNFLELVELLASYDKKTETAFKQISGIGNVSYTSGKIQKEIVEIFAKKVRKKIRDEIGDSFFSILVDESEDVSHKEQMVIVMRFVDKEGILRERFFDLVHVKNTTSSTLMNEILLVLSRNNLDIRKIRGQGYDGANNMRGHLNGLQSLIAKECPYAYYVHCLAHRLQLTLNAASTEVIYVANFFEKLRFIINSATGSTKRNDELQVAQVEQIAKMIENDEIETGKGLNQIGTLQKAGDTRFGSYLRSVSSLIKMYDATRLVLDNIIDTGKTNTQRGQAYSGLEAMNSFEFVFILNFIQELMEITDSLSQALQKKSLDIAHAMYLVRTTKTLVQKLRNNEFDDLLLKIKTFCAHHSIEVPNLSEKYKGRRGCSRVNLDDFTFEDHYKFDIFYATIDLESQELNSRFSEQAMELISLSCALDPREKYVSFDVERISELARKYYQEDFTELELGQLLIMELKHFGVEVSDNKELNSLSSVIMLCKWMVDTGRSSIYPLIFRLVTLVLTLPVSTATNERAFSATKIVKSRLRNKISDDYLTNTLLLYIERGIVDEFDIDTIINDFRDAKERKLLL